jgi:stage V sporulation protein D (sporulation-specific penicillin-binding protein)
LFADILPYLGIMPQYTEEELASLEKTVPDVTGLSIDAARKTVKDSGFTPIVAEGGGETVLVQMPRAGSKLTAGGKVLLYTESESYTIAEVPNVTGLTPSAAESILTGAGFNIRATGKDIQESGVTAASQSPAAGTFAELGSIVEVEFIHNDEADWHASGA